MKPHTPGPWKAIEWATNARTTVVSDARVGRIVVAECSGQGRHTNESLADAQLIAAAPELLDALQAAQQEFLGLSSYLETCEPVTIIENLDAVIASLKAKQAKAEAAIRKAKGESL